MCDLLFIREEITKELLRYERLKIEYKHNQSYILAFNLNESTLKYLFELVQLEIDTYGLETMLN